MSESGAGRSLIVEDAPPGPVAAAFMAARPRGPEGGLGIKALMGPIGSGKTTVVFLHMLELARQQPRSPIDGHRRFTACSIRDAYVRLHKTTITTWHKRIPRELGKWTGPEERAATHKVTLRCPDGGLLYFQHDFVAIGDQAAEDALRGYEPTVFYLNEADLLSEDVFTYAVGRAGRYPEEHHGGSSWFGILMDFNAPDVDHWLYRLCVEQPPPGLAYFRQPGGLEPGAENVHRLPPGYYQGQIAANAHRPDYVRRMVHAQWGYSRHGAAVFPEFADGRHVAPAPLEPIPGQAIVVGADAGRTPAAVFLQRDAEGQWRCLAELVAEGVGANRFGRLLARFAAERFPGCWCVGWGDPAAAHATQDGESSWLRLVAAASGIAFRPAPVPDNNLTVRLEVVRRALSGSLDEGRPEFLLSPDCRMLRKGFNSGYRFRRLQIAGVERYDDKPEKNEFSHVHDALQYALLGAGEYQVVMARQAMRRGALAPQIASHGFSPL